MSLKAISRNLIAIGCMAALPLYAQTAAKTVKVETKTEKKVETKSEAKPESKAEKKETKAEEKKETKAEEKKETKAEEKAEKKTTTHKSMKHASSSTAFNDGTRLAAILEDTQGKANINEASWKVIANESNTLARRMHASAKSSVKKSAADAAKHVSEMRMAALKGDAAGAKTHAAAALPYVYKVIDASAPASHM